jgi:hypothetical protein
MPPFRGLRERERERERIVSQYSIPEVDTSGYEYDGPAGPEGN